MALVDHWPFFALRVVTPRLELRYPDDELCVALAELASRGVHEPGVMPFSIPWTEAPPDELPRNSLQWYWRARAELSPAKWHMDLAVLVDGEVVGVQGLMATRFGERRGVETGSWLGLAHQNKGIGTEMRRAVLHLVFAGLGADFAETSAWEDNAASLAVTAKLGYQPTGDAIEFRKDVPTTMLRFRMDRSRWEADLAAGDITIDGLERCLPLLQGPPASDRSTA
jgi:RimJ/RimL family protein N-acetyltransferase